MQIEMLKAVSEMLSIKAEDKAELAFERVRCGKIMLDKIIEGMDKEPSYSKMQFDSEPEFEPQPQPQPEPKKKEPPLFFPVVDDHHKLDKILVMKDGSKVEAPEDMMVEIDGITMTHDQAKGKSFKELRVL